MMPLPCAESWNVLMPMRHHSHSTYSFGKAVARRYEVSAVRKKACTAAALGQSSAPA